MRPPGPFLHVCSLLSPELKAGVSSVPTSDLLLAGLQRSARLCFLCMSPALCFQVPELPRCLNQVKSGRERLALPSCNSGLI